MDKLSNDELLKIFQEYQIITQREIKNLETKLFATERVLVECAHMELTDYDTCYICQAITYTAMESEEIIRNNGGEKTMCCNRPFCIDCIAKGDQIRICNRINNPKIEGHHRTYHCKDCITKKDKFKF